MCAAGLAIAGCNDGPQLACDFEIIASGNVMFPSRFAAVEACLGGRCSTDEFELDPSSYVFALFDGDFEGSYQIDEPNDDGKRTTFVYAEPATLPELGEYFSVRITDVSGEVLVDVSEEVIDLHPCHLHEVEF
jgi:hypothetical protein